MNTLPAAAEGRPELSPRSAAARPVSDLHIADAAHKREPGCVERAAQRTPGPEWTRASPHQQGAKPPPSPERPPQVAWKPANGSRSNGGIPNPIDVRTDISSHIF